MQKLAQKQGLGVSLIPTERLEQALHILQLPLLELKELIEQEIVENPLVEEIEDEYSEPNETSSLENSFCYPAEELPDQFDIAQKETLQSRLLIQAQQSISDPEKLRCAEIIIGSLEANGLLFASLEELSRLGAITPSEVSEILALIQNFDPPGVASRSRREQLLKLLEEQKREKSFAYRIIKNHYRELLNARFEKIAAALDLEEEVVRSIIQTELAPLFIDPFVPEEEFATQQTPDLILELEDETLKVVIPETPWPPFRLKTIEDFAEEKTPELTAYVTKMRSHGYWLLQAVIRREELLRQIGKEIIKQCRHYFLDPSAKLKALRLQDLADTLGLHHSTLARAVRSKAIQTPKGLWPLKAFFTYRYMHDDGEEISATHIKQRIKTLIEQEDKCYPLSDEALCRFLKKEGTPCSRRTVAKYREQLSLKNSRKRKRKNK